MALKDFETKKALSVLSPPVSLFCFYRILTYYYYGTDLLLNRRTATWNLFVK